MSNGNPERADDRAAEAENSGTVAATVAPSGANDRVDPLEPLDHGAVDLASASVPDTGPAPAVDAGLPSSDVASGGSSRPEAPPAATPLSGGAAPAPEADALEELTLPSLVQAPSVLPAGTALGPEGRLRVGDHLGTRGRINRYAATWRQDDGQEVEVELREGPADHAGLAREAEILPAVQYAMLPRVYLTCEQDGRRYLALDRLEGPTLAEAQASGLDSEQALSIVLQLIQVVRRLHRAGWALLGLTPADVTLGEPLRLGQIGHAVRIGEPPPSAFQVAGYSAPELTSLATVTGKEDVFTLGALLYQALSGRPLSEHGGDLADLSTAVRVPGVPQLLADVLAPADERIDLDALYHRVLTLKNRMAEVSLTLDVASATTVGLNPTRLVNEDSCGYVLWSQAGASGLHDSALLCVADGMGGMEAGEIASQTALGVVMRAAGGVISSLPTPEAGAPEDRTEASARALDPVALVREAATAVHAAARGRNLGTTITCVAVHGGELTLGHVGDTRAYLLRDGVLSRLTADHSLVAAMVASGVISAEEAQGHPDSNKVLRSLGSQRELPEGYVDTLAAAYHQPILRLEPGDCLLLCSDGVWGSVEDPDIQVILTEALDSSNAARALVDRALAAGAPDNATALVARCVARAVLA